MSFKRSQRSELLHTVDISAIGRGRARHDSMQVDVEYTVGRQLRRRRDVVIGRMPIMLRSNCCVLNTATDAELVACNECPLDPGGYFVVRGTEKVILIQEQLSKNRMLVEKDSDGDVTVFVTSTDSERKTMTKLKHKKGIFLLAHSIFEKPVNLCIVFKALGIESDQVRHSAAVACGTQCTTHRESQQFEFDFALGKGRPRAATVHFVQSKPCCRSFASWWEQMSDSLHCYYPHCMTPRLRACTLSGTRWYTS